MTQYYMNRENHQSQSELQTQSIQSNQSKAKVISALYDLIKVVNNMAIV